MAYRAKHNLKLLLSAAALLFTLSIGLAQAKEGDKPATEVAAAVEEDVGRQFKIWDVTFNAQLDFPECGSGPTLSGMASGGSCVGFRTPDEMGNMPFMEYVDLVGTIWYNNYDTARPTYPLLAGGAPLLGVDEQKRLVYWMVYPKDDEASQELIFTDLKALFGEPDVLVVKESEDLYPPENSPIHFDEWHAAEKDTRIALWNNEEVWVRYVFSTGGGAVLVIGLTRIVTDGEIPPTFSIY